MEIDGVFSFNNVDELVKFLVWVVESFQDEKEFNEWFNSKQPVENDIDSQFWSIINNEYNKKSTNFPSTD